VLSAALSPTAYGAWRVEQPLQDSCKDRKGVSKRGSPYTGDLRRLVSLPDDTQSLLQGEMLKEGGIESAVAGLDDEVSAGPGAIVPSIDPVDTVADPIAVRSLSAADCGCWASEIWKYAP
jgi:hypothetical protein